MLLYVDYSKINLNNTNIKKGGSKHTHVQNITTKIKRGKFKNLRNVHNSREAMSSVHVVVWFRLIARAL